MSIQASYLETLRRIASGMGPGQGFHASLLAILDLLAIRHGFLRAHLVIFDPETRTLRLCVSEDTPRSKGVSYEPGIGVTGQVFASGKPVIVECLRDTPEFLSKFFARTPEELATLAFLSVPVLAPSLPGGMEGRVTGVLSVDTPCTGRDILELHCRFLEVVAGLIASQAAHLQEDMARQRHLDEQNTSDLTEMHPDPEPFPVAASESMRQALDFASRAAHGRSTVLLSGEPGAGKASLAAYIHALSERQHMPMIRFNCAASEKISTSVSPEHQLLLLERELFGYRKGAFAGASQTRKGVFELAHCSTLFLEHIDRLPLPILNRLLLTLQEQMIRRVGGGEPIQIDVRLICSTVEGLEQRATAGMFPQELYRRIASVSLSIDPLRERTEDILPLANHFLRCASEKASPPALSQEVCDCLCAYGWPGNVDELARCMEQAFSICDGTEVQLEHLPPSLQSTGSISFQNAVASFERQLLSEALQHSGGNMLQAARDLRTSYRIINYKIKKYALDPHHFQS